MSLRKKKCIKCNLTKPLARFTLNPSSKDGRRGECKVCNSKYSTQKRKERYNKLSEEERYLQKEKWKQQYTKNIQYYHDRYKNKPISRTLSQKLSSYKRMAKKRGYSFELTKEEFVILTLGSCYYCGEVEAGGVDRFDNNEGYTIENSKPCCKTCNYMKMSHDFDFMITHMKKVITNFEVGNVT
jgi:hypothetical protein